METAKKRMYRNKPTHFAIFFLLPGSSLLPHHTFFSDSSNYLLRQLCNKHRQPQTRRISTNCFAQIHSYSLEVSYTDMANGISVLGGNFESFYLLRNIQMQEFHSKVKLVNWHLITKDSNTGLVCVRAEWSSSKAEPDASLGSPGC